MAENNEVIQKGFDQNAHEVLQKATGVFQSLRSKVAAAINEAVGGLLSCPETIDKQEEVVKGKSRVDSCHFFFRLSYGLLIINLILFVCLSCL